jgi:hypothetical protein
VTRPIPHNIPTNGTYETVDRLTKLRVAAPTFEILVDKMMQNRGKIGAVCGAGMREEIENWVCEEHPEDCTIVDMNIPRKVRLTLTDVLRGSRVMASFVMGGAKPEARDEAERRAKICLGCEFNSLFPKPCVGVCGELKEMAIRISGNQGTQYDRGLHSCSICGCFLQAAIWIPLENQCKGVTETMKKQFACVKDCWKQC